MSKKTTKASPPPLQHQMSNESMDASNPIHTGLPPTPASTPGAMPTFDWSNEAQFAAAFERYCKLHPEHLAKPRVPLPVASFNHFPHLYDEIMEAKLKESTPHFNKPFQPDELKQVVSFDNIRPPELKKPDLAEMKTFWKLYVRYRKDLDDKYEQFGGHVGIQLKSIRQCMDEYTFESLCIYRWRKDPADITSDEVYRLFELDCMGSKTDIKHFMDRLERDLKMDGSVNDGPSRILCLVRRFDQICTECGFPKYYEIEVETARQYFLNALEPVNVRRKIATKLRFSKKRYMVWKDFIDLCIDYMKTWCLYEDAFRPDKNDKSKKKHTPGPSENQQKGDPKEHDDDKKAKTKYACIKCNSNDHNVWKCPDLKSKDEAKALLRDWYQARKAQQVDGDAKPKSIQLGKGQKPSSGTIAAATSTRPHDLDYISTAGNDFVLGICAGLDIRVLFDSGSDACVITRNFIDRANTDGESLKLIALSSPARVFAFNGAMSVVVSLNVPTKNGPIFLKNIKCWVQDGDLPAGSADLLISKTVMKTLGFDQSLFLRNARNIRPEWDLEPQFNQATNSMHIGSLRVQPDEDCVHDGGDICLPEPEPLDVQRSQ
ncbi:unnamed protein product, partial [Aphanomyces euteiches]